MFVVGPIEEAVWPEIERDLRSHFLSKKTVTDAVTEWGTLGGSSISESPPQDESIVN